MSIPKKKVAPWDEARLGKELLTHARNGEVEEIAELCDPALELTSPRLLKEAMFQAARGGHLGAMEGVFRAKGWNQEDHQPMRFLDPAIQSRNPDAVQWLLEEEKRMNPGKQSIAQSDLEKALKGGAGEDILCLLLRTGVRCENVFILNSVICQGYQEALTLLITGGHGEHHRSLANWETVTAIKTARMSQDLAGGQHFANKWGITLKLVLGWMPLEILRNKELEDPTLPKAKEWAKEVQTISHRRLREEIQSTRKNLSLEI
jgi:hypothetical protein